MIYTVTFNPAIEYVVYTEAISSGSIMRSSRENIYFGGKGINVSLILRELDTLSTALGFIAGFTGEAIEKNLLEKGIATDFIRLPKGLSRINVKIRADMETDINASGPKIEATELELFFNKLDNIKKGDTLILAGSVPRGLPNNVYEVILERLRNKDIRFVVDAEGELLKSCLKYRPFLIKPNKEELEELFSVKLSSKGEILDYAKKLTEMGAENVLVSLGGEGAVLLTGTEDNYFEPALGGKPVNTVGAGDSMLAGFIAGYLKTGDFSYALKLGSACGGATACSEGLATKEEINKLL